MSAPDLPETPNLGIKWCPTCEPARDPSREILATRYCDDHEPDAHGDADDHNPASWRWLTGAAEAEGADCRAMQRLIT